MRWLFRIHGSPLGGRFSRRLREKKGDIVQENRLTLNQLEIGQKGKVVELRGGGRFIHRLESLGIRPGVKVTKVSSMLFRGPVVLKVGRSQIAIGHGMSNRVWIEPDKTP